jgi:hypothetical protein
VKKYVAGGFLFPSAVPMMTIRSIITGYLVEHTGLSFCKVAYSRYVVLSKIF